MMGLIKGGVNEKGTTNKIVFVMIIIYLCTARMPWQPNIILLKALKNMRSKIFNLFES